MLSGNMAEPVAFMFRATQRPREKKAKTLTNKELQSSDIPAAQFREQD